MLLAYFYLGGGGVYMYKNGVYMYQNGVYTYRHPLFFATLVTT